MSDKMIYAGAFLSRPLVGTLDAQIMQQHVTFVFKPDTAIQEIVKKHVGETLIFKVVGYGCDKKNEGLLVELVKPVNAEIQTLFNNIQVPHITLSIAKGAKPKDTASLVFEELPPFNVYATFGYFNGTEVII